MLEHSSFDNTSTIDRLSSQDQPYFALCDQTRRKEDCRQDLEEQIQRHKTQFLERQAECPLYDRNYRQ